MTRHMEDGPGTARSRTADVTRVVPCSVLAVLPAAAARAAAPDPAGIEFFEAEDPPRPRRALLLLPQRDRQRSSRATSASTPHGSLKGGDLGPSVVPGDPDQPPRQGGAHDARCPRGLRHPRLTNRPYHRQRIARYAQFSM